MAVVVPTLSSAGWVKTPEIMLLKILEQYASSDPSQSNIYEVYSMNDRLIKHGSQPVRLADVIRQDLSILIGQHFDEKNIDVSFNMRDTISYDLTVKVTVTVDGKVVGTESAYQVVNGKLKVI